MSLKTTGKKKRFIAFPKMTQRKYIDPIDESDGIHRIAGPASLEPENIAMANELHACLRRIIIEISTSRKETPEQAAQNIALIEMYAGIDGPRRTFRQIACELSTTKQSVSNRIVKLLTIIRRNEKYQKILDDYR